MKGVSSLLAWTLPALLVTVLSCWSLLWYNSEPEQFLTNQPASKCKEDFRLTPAQGLPPGVITPLYKGWYLRGNGWLVAVSCRPGTLLLDVQGEAGGADLPRLDITINQRQLTSLPVLSRRTVRIHLPEAGRLTVGFLNDYYQSVARTAFFSDLRFQGEHCRQLEVSVPDSAIGGYDEGRRELMMSGSGPVRIQPCSAGRLSFQVYGKNAQGSWPKLRLTQGNVLAREISTADSRSYVELALDGSPLLITLLNPYTKELADRNLIVHGVSFFPDQK